MRQILERAVNHNLYIYAIFIDFKKAFDKLNRNRLLYAMNALNIPQKIINLTKMTLVHNEAQVLTPAGLTDEFSITTGVRQGDVLSPTLFKTSPFKS